MSTKELISLLCVLRISGQSGTIHIEPLQLYGEEPWLAHLLLLTGEVHSCQVLKKRDGLVLLSGKKVIPWLETKGRFSLRFEESSQPTFPSSSLLASSTQLPVQPANELERGLRVAVTGPLQGLVPTRQEERLLPLPSKHISPLRVKSSMSMPPRRTSNGTHMMMTGSWSREYRQVFALVDGHRTTAEIASLLHLSTERAAWVLRELEARGMIER